METQNSSNALIKERIKKYFIEDAKDKRTGIMEISCSRVISWGKYSLENRFMPTMNDSHRLELRLHKLLGEIDYRINVVYSNTNDGFPDMNNFKLLLKLDDKKTINLIGPSGSKTLSRRLDASNIAYSKGVQLKISSSDFYDVAKASKVDYSIQFGTGKLDRTFSEEKLIIFKGFYNATSNDDFELERLSNYLDSISFAPKGKKSESGGCYIATMAYGSYEHPQVMVLRNFRDGFLARRKWGIKFIETYYKYSPGLAERLENKAIINKFVRKILDLFIESIK